MYPTFVFLFNNCCDAPFIFLFNIEQSRRPDIHREACRRVAADSYRLLYVQFFIQQDFARKGAKTPRKTLCAFASLREINRSAELLNADGATSPAKALAAGTAQRQLNRNSKVGYIPATNNKQPATNNKR